MAPKSLGAWPWCSPSAAQAYRPHLEGKARFPVSGCGVVWQLKVAMAGVRLGPKMKTM